MDYSEKIEIKNINSEIRNRKNLKMNAQTAESAECRNNGKRELTRCIKTAVCYFEETHGKCFYVFVRNAGFDNSRES